MLRGIQERAATAGVTLDVGEVPNVDTPGTDNGDDPERLTRIVAHAIARVGDRFTVVRKFSRHLEGSEKRAGILSDITAALMELYRRNPEVMESLGKQTVANVIANREARASKAAAKTSTTQPTPNGGSPQYAPR